MARIVLLAPLLLLGCATQPQQSGFDDINVAHTACYSYSYGLHGFDVNYQKAFEWCSIASNLGNSSAQTLLAEGFSVEKTATLSGLSIDDVKALAAGKPSAS